MTEAGVLHVLPGAIPRAIQACPAIKDWLEDQIRKGEIIADRKLEVRNHDS